MLSFSHLIILLLSENGSIDNIDADCQSHIICIVEFLNCVISSSQILLFFIFIELPLRMNVQTSFFWPKMWYPKKRKVWWLRLKQNKTRLDSSLPSIYFSGFIFRNRFWTTATAYHKPNVYTTFYPVCFLCVWKYLTYEV